ncbi:hypothetical protein [uncultured Arenimonas sp.]|uniref:hypothetical protein n=1 Tax=uncultured Arenimonas sp. TaxID=546226 RepID=UPI0030DD8B43
MRVPTTILIAAAALVSACDADAYVVNINMGTDAVYLRVGDGNFIGTYANSGIPQSGGAISRVSVTVPQAAVGNGTPQVMTANGRLTSDWDGYLFCNPGQLYVGGFYRRSNNANVNATLTVTAPAALVNADGDTIPISDISWTSSGNGDGGATQPVPSGSFQAGTRTLANDFRRNTWRESCLTFRYANTQLAAGGTYTARVTYTLTAP